MEKEDNKLKLIPKIEKYVNKIKNKLNISNIGIMLIILILGVFNVIIGANEKGLRVLAIGVLMFFIIIFLIAKKIKYKDENLFFKNKIDIFVLIFMLTTTLPLIFKTYGSYSDTIQFIMKYFFIYSVYLLVRNSVKTKKQIEIIITFTLIFSLIPIILGLEVVGGNYLEDLTQNLHIPHSELDQYSATFGYANVVAIYMQFCIFLVIHKFIYNKSKILKIIDVIYFLFICYVFYLTSSKAVMLVFGISIIILVILKYKKYILKNKFKILILLVLGSVILALYLTYALNHSSTMIIKEKKFDRFINYAFIPNETYNIEFDFEKNDTNNFTIQIIEKSKYYFDTILESKDIKSKVEKIQLEIKPTDNLNYILLRVKNENGNIIKIKDCYINGKEHILKYKMLPDISYEVFSGYLTKGKSIHQRYYMYKDCLKMASQSPILGQGGNTWKCQSRAVEEYRCAWKESHSYFFELLISYGIVGVAAFLVMTNSFFIKIFKKCKKDEETKKQLLLITVGVFNIVLHSFTFDFNMSFMLIQLLVYIFMAVAMYKENEKIKIPKVLNYIIMIFLIVILVLYIGADVSKYIIKDNSIRSICAPYERQYYFDKIRKNVENNNDYIGTLKDIQNYIENEPYYDQTEIYNMYFKTIYNNLDIIENEELNEYFDFIIYKLNTIKFKTPLYIYTAVNRAEMLVKHINYFENYIKLKENINTSNNYNLNKKGFVNDEKLEIINNIVEELKNIVNKEYEINMKNIKDTEKTGYEEDYLNNLEKRYNRVVDLIINKK